MSTTSNTTHVFHVSGMHCKACTVLIEDAIKELPNVHGASVSLHAQEVTVTGDFDGTEEEIAAQLSSLVRTHGYEISVEKNAHVPQWSDFAYAFPIAVLFVAGFFMLQKTGLVNLVTSSEVNYGTAFLIGIIASVSSCLAVVGGLVLSLAASSAKRGRSSYSQVLFHLGRFGGFFLLGGLVGLLGSSLHLGLITNIVLGILISVVMLVLGVNLLDVFHGAKRLQLTLPASMSRYVTRGKEGEHYLAPLLLGAGTFFLPCGFTQSMQLYAFSTGQFMSGALTMTVFALGTFPVLALLSFGSFNIAHTPWKGIFFKTAGLVVIALALFTLAGALATAGLIKPLFNI